ncbi:MAG TPA: ATP-binding cassette domain-containing protein [Candidatus Dormibacteraeota bacterium]|nr:ATP-binding cassette domain-containing protein [Candidatus Dormibacteraeota bacterium]
MSAPATSSVAGGALNRLAASLNLSRPRFSPLTLLLTATLAGFLFLPNDLLYAGSSSVVAGLIGIGLFLPIAALRELPFNGAGLAGLAAYLFAYNGSQGGIGHHLIGILVAVICVVGLSLVGGLASLAVTGLYLVVATLVIQVGIEKVIFSIPVLTGGASGRSVYQPDFSGWFSTQRAIYVVAAVVVFTAMFAVHRLLRSKLGFNAVLVGHVPEGAQATGLRNWAVKLLVFGFSGLLIAVAGCMSAFVNGTPPPPFSFGIIYSVIFIAIPIASGMRDLSSIVLLAAVFVGLPITLEHFDIRIVPDLLSGVILLSALLLARNRDRIGSLVRGGIARLRGQQPASPEAEMELTGIATNGAAANGGSRVPLSDLTTVAPPVVAPSSRISGAAALEGRQITVRFGGVVAVDGVSVRVGPGERVGIVGANGACKTTLFNALTGFVPCEGTVMLGGEDITGRAPFLRARDGVRRTFQQPRLADILTVGQNVICGHGAETPERVERIAWLLDHFGLAAMKDVPVIALPFGVRREVELIRALSVKPQVVMLDEPVSGLEDEEADRLVDVLIGLQAREGWGLLVIEHDLKFITAIAQHLMVMEDGHLLVQGPIDSVMKEPEVRRVYLGEAVTV